MIRGLGALLLFCGCGWLGWALGRQGKDRARLLRQFIGVLEQLRREMSFRLTPLPELFHRLAQNGEEPLSGFLERCARCAGSLDAPFQTGWNAAVRELEPELGKEAVESLCRLGSGLGRCDGAREQEGLACSIEELRAIHARVEEAARREERLYRSLGLTGGALLVILFL